MKRAESLETFLSTAEVAELLGVTETGVRVWAFRKQIPCLKIGGRLRFKESEVLDWIESQRKVTPDQAMEAVGR